MWDVNSEESCTCTGTDDVWNPVFPAQFCYELRTALRNKINLMKKYTHTCINRNKEIALKSRTEEGNQEER